MTDAGHLTQQPGANEPVIHARQTAGDRALCGEPPGTPYTLVRRFVTCAGCRAEIERRLAARGARGQP